MTDRFTLSPFEFYVRHTRTRFPFRYGIASMTEVPHLFARTTVAVAGKSSIGLGAEGLPPKWFTKNHAATFNHDLPRGARLERAHPDIQLFNCRYATPRADGRRPVG